MEGQEDRRGSRRRDRCWGTEQRTAQNVVAAGSAVCGRVEGAAGSEYNRKEMRLQAHARRGMAR